MTGFLILGLLAGVSVVSPRHPWAHPHPSVPAHGVGTGLLWLRGSAALREAGPPPRLVISPSETAALRLGGRGGHDGTERRKLCGPRHGITDVQLAERLVGSAAHARIGIF